MRPAQEDHFAGLFNPSATRRILMMACRDVGMDGTGAVLLRHGENAVYRLVHHPVVARIARHADAPRTEVAVAAWLARSDLPAVRLCDGPDQLLVIDGRVITWWELIVESSEKPTFEDLALEREIKIARPLLLGGYAIGLVSVALLTIAWMAFFYTNKVSDVMLTVTTPVLVGLFTVSVLLPALVRLKLPGFEADLSPGSSTISSGPTGAMMFGPGRSAKSFWLVIEGFRGLVPGPGWSEAGLGCF